MSLVRPITAPTEADGVRVRHTQNNTQAHIKRRTDSNLGRGTVYISESEVTWVGGEGQGFCLQYPSISLHAISRDLSAFPHECLYLMIDSKLNGEEGSGSESGDEETESSGNITEVRFVPEDKNCLDTMFKAMSACQQFHPDPEDSLSEEEGFYEDVEGVELSDQGEATLQRMEEMLTLNGGSGENGRLGPEVTASGDVENGEENMETGQFDDAE